MKGILANALQQRILFLIEENSFPLKNKSIKYRILLRNNLVILIFRHCLLLHRHGGK